MTTLYEEARYILNNDIQINLKLCNKYKVRPISIYWRCPDLESVDDWKKRQIKRILEVGYWKGILLLDKCHYQYQISLNNSNIIKIEYTINNGVKSIISQINSNDLEQHIDEWYQGLKQHIQVESLSKPPYQEDVVSRF